MRVVGTVFLNKLWFVLVAREQMVQTLSAPLSPPCPSSPTVRPSPPPPPPAPALPNLYLHYTTLFVVITLPHPRPSLAHFLFFCLSADSVFFFVSLQIVYVAPMKALAAEMTNYFSKRLEPLGIAVKELTGDMQLTKGEILRTQVHSRTHSHTTTATV